MANSIKLDGPSVRTNKHAALDKAGADDEDAARVSGTKPAEFPEPTMYSAVHKIGALMNSKNVGRFLAAMGAFWLVFGLVTIFAPSLMDLFQTPAGVEAKSAFSNHVWMHGGFDIVSFSILLFALSRTTPTPWILRAVGLAGLMPTIAITISLVATPYWSPLFVVAAAGCLAFSVGSFMLARSASTAAT